MTPTLLLLLAAAPPADPPDAFLRQYVETRRFAAGRPARPALTPDGDAALFLRSGPRSPVQSLFETDLVSGRTRELASAEGILAGASDTLTAAERAQLERQRISARGITGYQLSRDGKRVAVALGGRLFLVERAGGPARPLRTSGRPLDPRFAPDGRSLAYVVDRDLRVLDLAAGEERRLTRGGSEEVSHGVAEFIAQEELNRFEGYWWAPDSRRIAYQETDEREVEKFTIHDPLHPERPADVFRYPRAGKTNARVRIGVVSAAGGPTTWLEWDRERWPYVAHVEWPERGPLSVVVLNRRQSEMVLLAADPDTGATRPLVEERDPRWLEVHARYPRWLGDGTGFFWFTERNGGPEVELRSADGKLRESWVRPEHGLENLATGGGGWVGFDEKRRWLWFTGGPDPSESHLWVARKAGRPERFAAGGGPATTRAWLSRGGDVVLVARNSFAGAEPPVAFAADGRRLASLPSVAEPPPFATRGEIRRVGPGEGLYALVVRPRHLGPGRKLPTVVAVYGGPGFREAVVAPRLLEQWLADQGFLVVAVDGRGTPGRGRAWARAIAGDLGGPALEDQVAGLRALAAEVPELDLERVGVWGGSFGGYMAALAVLRRPDVFRAAVAIAPVTDWRDYDTAYAERYLGLPDEDPAAYRRSSLLTWADRLERPLLVVHGSADDNVYFFHGLKLADALFRAGGPSELLVLPGLTHGALASTDAVLVRRTLERIAGFFRKNL
jgi:dipeptidyl-peptidase-4